VRGQRNRLTSEALGALHALGRARGVELRRNAMFAGDQVNRSERRAALHVALRAADPQGDRPDLARQVLPARNRMRDLAEALHAGTMRSSTGEPITDIVNIGIGGSDFGTRLLCDALGDLAPDHLRVHFLSGVDGLQIERLCRSLDAHRAIFVVSSKSFSTVETLLNAKTLMHWFGGRSLNVADHWFAVTGNAAAAERLGIPRENVLDVPEWVGGRFSAWGAVGLPAALYLGWPAYREWLEGGAEMDAHHLHAPLEDNLPVRLALLNVWHSTFLGCPSHCIASYDNRLSEFLTWAQQLEMESNGKHVTDDGLQVDYPTAPIVWGGLGNNGQHTYYQLLREGTQRNAVTLITVDTASSVFPEHAEALARQAEAQIEALASHEGGPGFNSVTHLRMRDLTPRSLGALMSAFEHATTVSAWIWGINPFDQPGVELGKKLAASKQTSLA
jgi:glucose-6-phosphate isomerase